MESLVLNAAAVPVSVVPVKRALTLIVLNKAIALENYEGVARAEMVSIPLPSVIQCIHSGFMPKRYTKILPFSRKNVYIRDGGCCMYCGKKVSIHSFTFDHVIPRCEGGQACWENIVVSCMKCNTEKGRKSLKGYKRPLIRRPFAPRLDKAAPAHIVSRIASEIPHKSWNDYVYWNVILKP